MQRFPGQVHAVFADVKIEDPDLYRFLDEVESYLGQPLTRIEDGRDVWQVFFDEGMMGSSMADPCSRILKRELIESWITANFSPQDTVRAFGFSYKEVTRFNRLKARMAPFFVWCPLQEPPFLGPCEANQYVLDQWDIDPPRLYELGFKHNNCGGACVKAGHGQWALLLRKRPETYRWWEENEQKFRLQTGKDVAILKDRRGGMTKPMTLCQLRHRIENEGYAPTNFGESCNCMGL